MQPARKLDIHQPTPVSERLTWQAICASHPEQWVVLVDVVKGCDTLRAVNPTGAGYGEFAYRYTGRVNPAPSGWPLRWL